MLTRIGTILETLFRPAPARPEPVPAAPALRRVPPEPTPLQVRLGVPTELIVGTRQAFRAEVERRLEAGAREILCDCRDTRWMDASGMGILVSLAKRARERGARLVIANLNDDLRNLFELTKLDTLFELIDERQEA